MLFDFNNYMRTGISKFISRCMRLLQIYIIPHIQICGAYTQVSVANLSDLSALKHYTYVNTFFYKSPMILAKNQILRKYFQIKPSHSKMSLVPACLRCLAPPHPWWTPPWPLCAPPSTCPTSRRAQSPQTPPPAGSSSFAWAPCRRRSHRPLRISSQR